MTKFAPDKAFKYYLRRDKLTFDERSVVHRLVERCAEKLATEKWKNGEIGAILSTFEKFMVLNFSKVDEMAPISRFSIISRGQLLCTALYLP